MPITGKYTTNYFNDKSDVGCECMLNDRFSSSDEIFADNHNFSQFKLKGKFHCDGAAADGVERLQEITAYLLVSGGDGKLRPTAEVICSLTHAFCTRAPTGDFYGGYILCQSHLFISCPTLRVYNVVFESHYFQLT